MFKVFVPTVNFEAESLAPNNNPITVQLERGFETYRQGIANKVHIGLLPSFLGLELNYILVIVNLKISLLLLKMFAFG